MSLIADYNKHSIHTFQVRTLRSLAYRTRVTLCNRTQSRPDLATDLVVIENRFNPGEEKAVSIINHGKISPNESRVFHCDENIPLSESDQIVIFEMIPEKFSTDSNDLVSISKDELMFYMTSQDHYVEYFDETGFSTGVLYQCAAFNYPKFSPDSSTILQAPKCYVSQNVNTYLSVIYTYFKDPTLTKLPPETSHLEVVLTDRIGKKVARWTEKINRFQSKLIDIRQKLQELQIPISTDYLDFYCVYALSTDAILLPLTFTHNEAKKTLTVEHSLAPIYYGTAIRGPSRKKTILDLGRIGVFGDAHE